MWFQCVCECLEFQFDSVLSDRALILHKLYLLSVVLRRCAILSWPFFLDRFDALCLEAQLLLDDASASGDLSRVQGALSQFFSNSTFTNLQYTCWISLHHSFYSRVMARNLMK